MVVFFVFVIIGVVVGYIITYKWKKDSVDESWIIAASWVIAVSLGIGLSFFGGSFFVKKEVLVKKFFISPIIFDGKFIAALREEDEKDDSPLTESYNYFFQIKEGDKTKLIKQRLKKRDVFFSLDKGEERYMEIKRSKTCKGRMWVWFFYGGTGTIESKAVLKKEDSFLILPKYYSF